MDLSSVHLALVIAKDSATGRHKDQALALAPMRNAPRVQPVRVSKYALLAPPRWF